MLYLKLFEQFGGDYSNLHNEIRNKYPSINRGGCAVFAKAFNEVTNYPIYLIFDKELTEEDPPIHVVIKLPNGSYIDGESIRTENQIREYYDDGETGELEFVEDTDQYNLFDKYYDELGEGLFTTDHKDDYTEILNIIKSNIN